MLINIKYFFHNRKIQQVPYKKYYIVYIKQIISNLLNTLKIVWYIIHNTIYYISFTTLIQSTHCVHIKNILRSIGHLNIAISV